ncbi:hypothetical protein TSA66_00460 [Noviherbaspirillum autotrophicum]|uniref:Uncharacterized protein n=1 Tax=Noviherbaspirillum autotrophicum TaxID=709839 RepID=A0A0C1YTY3_9BURK|nr:hypothetical protein TSA66_00460 [Noviherbaspirillum autotrophicum]
MKENSQPFAAFEYVDQEKEDYALLYGRRLHRSACHRLSMLFCFLQNLDVTSRDQGIQDRAGQRWRVQEYC